MKNMKLGNRENRFNTEGTEENPGQRIIFIIFMTFMFFMVKSICLFFVCFVVKNDFSVPLWL